MSFWDSNPPPDYTTGQGFNETAAGAGSAVPIGSGVTSMGVSSPEAQQAGPGGATGGGSYGNLSDPSAWMKLVQQGPGAVGDWLAQSNPQLAQLFQANPGLKDYYAQQIIKSPGANPTEQAGSAQYWTNKALQDPGISGSAGGPRGVSSSNPNGIPGLDPGFDFQAQQAAKAIQRSAASRGTLLTGGTLKGLADYIGGDLASSAYQGAFNRNYSLASLGENAAAGQGSNNTSYANNAANTITSGANAQGAAGIATGNIVSNAANNAATGYTLSKLFPNALNTQQISPYAPPSTGAYG